MNLLTSNHREQCRAWPAQGRHILAQFDDERVVVYQAFSPAIGRWAVEHQRFGGPFSMARMSWVKPNFLWMMYRSGWGTKADQEVTLAVSLRRPAFGGILAAAVHSTFTAAAYDSPDQWRAAVARSSVRLQWDPDHGPGGDKLDRRAVQLGLRDDALARYAGEWLVSIEDVSPFVAEQRAVLAAGGRDTLVTPTERVYPVTDPAVAARLGLSSA